MGMAAAVSVGALGAATSLGSSLIGANAAEEASSQQVAQDQAALSTQVQGENAALGVQAPFVDVGTGATHDLANLFGISFAAQPSGTTSAGGVVTPANSNAGVSSPGGPQVQAAADQQFLSSPNYQFAFTQGLQALDRSAAASGTLQSGGQAKASQEFGQGLASQQFGNYVSQLQGLANLGSGAANTSSNVATSSANSQANTLQGIGTAQASGTVGAANALSSGLTGIGSAAQSSLLLSKLGGASPSAFTSAGNGPTSDSFANTLSDPQLDTFQDAGFLG
jgi:hypothetical protein